MTSAPALLITHDETLLEDLLRLAAAAGTTLDVAHDSASALRGWSGASVVLVGADESGRVAEQHPPRRDGVHVVARAPVDDGLFRSALAVGAADVVELPAAESWLVEVLTDAADGTARRARTLGVVSGSGGAGATTFACALAQTAGALGPAVLLDLDPLGPGVDRVVGLDAVAGVRWDALVDSRGRLASRSLRAALPGKDGLAVLTWSPGSPVPLDVALVREVLSAAQRGNDVVLVDLPRSMDAVTAEVVTRCDLVVVVVEPSVPGVASAARLTASLRQVGPRVGLVVRTGAAGVPAEDVAATLTLPLLTEMRSQRRLAEHVDLGLGPVHSRRSPLARAARATFEALAATGAQQVSG
jgi:secretion/DNA translocation related CpaE-like protein